MNLYNVIKAPRIWLALFALCAELFPLSSFAQTEAWPTRSLRIICACAAGTSPDMQARLIAEPLSKALGRPVVVEDRPGAAGNIGADAVAKATDGHTIGIIGNGPLASSKFLYNKLPFNPGEDFAPIVLVATAPFVWVASKADVKGTTAEYLASIRRSGDKLNYGSIGVGSGGHLGMELISDSLGFKALHVPYPGGPQMLTAILAGDIQMTLLVWSTVAPMVQSGKLMPIAISSAERNSLLPNIPGMKEIGVNGVNLEGWNAIMAPASMPQEHQARLNAEIGRILTNKEISTKLQQSGWSVPDTSIKTLKDRLKSDTATYGDLISKKGFKLE